MSSDRGRSWRPEKKVTARQSRRKQIMGLVALLIVLVGVVGWLFIAPRVPLAQLLVVSEKSFTADNTYITQLPPGSTSINASRLLKVAERLHEREPTQVARPAAFDTVAALAEAVPESEDKLLIVYLTAAALVAPEVENVKEVGVQLLPADPAGNKLSFAKLLSLLRESGSKRTLLLLELTGRNPALASGVLADDFRECIERELRAESVPGLTVICANDKNERSWEYFEVAPVAAIDASEAAIPKTVPPELPEFDGTVFGHFLVLALEEGEARTPKRLFNYLEHNVAGWVQSHYGCTQTVWMFSADNTDQQSKLIVGGRLPKEAVETKGGKDTSVATSESEKSQSDDSKADTASGAPGSDTSTIDDRPVALLKLVMNERDRLAEGTTPVRFTAVWLRLQMHMVAAERFAMNRNKTEFNRIHDEVLKTSLNQMNKPDDPGTKDGRPTIPDWLLLSQDADAEVAGLRFGQMLQDFGVEPGKAPPLPKELQSPGPVRQAFAIELGKELKALAQSIDTLPESDRTKRMQQLTMLLENIIEKGWRLNDFPESMATYREVLQSWKQDQDPNALRLKPLVRLSTIRQNALRLAAGYGSEKRQLRRATWENKDIADQLDRILIDLNSAERWLCIGPDAVALAADRMDDAQKAFDGLRREVDEYEKLSEVQDAQKLELPFLIEYLAQLQESTSLPDTELRAAGRMAEPAQAGSLTLEDFPTGQLGPIGFNREHLAAMLALTRNFSGENRVTIADGEHLKRLRDFANSRSPKSISASERLQILNIPQFAGRAQLFDSLQSLPEGRNEISTDKSSRSGIWLSFWSLRLVDAISGGSQDTDWKKWSALVTAIGDEEKGADIPMLRTELAGALQRRWIKAIGSLTSGSAADIFVSQKDVLDLLSKEVSRRAQTSANPGLFLSISQTTGAKELNRSATRLNVLSPDATPSPNGSFEIPLKVHNVSRLYVQNENFTVLNQEKQSHRQWTFLPVNTAESEQTVTLRLQANSTLASPLKVTLIGVNPQGAAVVTDEVTLHPSSENEWRLEVVQVEEGKTTERGITLSDGKTRSESYLPLPPSTFDGAKNMHAPILLNVRLNRVKGVAKKIQVRMRSFDRRIDVWATVELSIPEGESRVTVPLTQSANAATAPTTATPPAAAASPAFDITDGIVFEVTPLDLPQQVTSTLILYPRLHSPENMFEIPEPVYDHRAGELTLRLERKALIDSTKIWPAQFPGEVSLNPTLRQYLKSGELTTLNADGFTFRAQFRPEIEKTIGNSACEFGISLAGVPHAWWWGLTESAPERIRGIRSFLVVENSKEIIPVAQVPALLIGEGWRKAYLQSEIFLHGIRFDQEQDLTVRIGSAGSDGSTPATDRPIPVNSRFVESGQAAPGENGVWQLSTLTKPYGISSFTPETFSLNNGRYEFIASLRTRDRSSEPIESGVLFTLDDSPPVLDDNSIEIKPSPTLVTDSLKGRITVRDPESRIARIRVGLKEDLMQDLKFEPDTEVVEDFELDSLGFPKLEQTESGTKGYGILTVEVTNTVGLVKKHTKQVAFFRPGKAVVMKEKPKAPGSIKVTFGIAAEFTVSVSGPDGYMDEKAGMSPVVFDEVPPGACSVKWKPKQGTAGSGADSSVVVRSGRTTTVKGN